MTTLKAVPTNTELQTRDPLGVIVTERQHFEALMEAQIAEVLGALEPLREAMKETEHGYAVACAAAAKDLEETLGDLSAADAYAALIGDLKAIKRKVRTPLIPTL